MSIPLAFGFTENAWRMANRVADAYEETWLNPVDEEGERTIGPEQLEQDKATANDLVQLAIEHDHVKAPKSIGDLLRRAATHIRASASTEGVSTPEDTKEEE